MAQHHGYKISDLEDMVPFELDIYVSMVKAYLRELAEKSQT
jgi:hypothetical protein